MKFLAAAIKLWNTDRAWRLSLIGALAGTVVLGLSYRESPVRGSVTTHAPQTTGSDVTGAPPSPTPTPAEVLKIKPSREMPGTAGGDKSDNFATFK